MRINRFAVLIILIMTVSGFCFASAQQEYQEKIKVINRITDFRVVDRDGLPVKNLGTGDFQIKVDGKVVRITALDEFKGIPLDSEIAKRFELDMITFRETGGAAPTAPTKPRYFYFLFNVHDSGDRANVENINSALKMVDNILLPHDRSGVLVYNGTMRILQPLTTDHEAVKAAINKARMPRMSYMYYPIPEEIQAKEKRSFPKPAEDPLKIKKPIYAIDNVSNTEEVDSTGNNSLGNKSFSSESILKMHMTHKEIEFRNYISAMTAFAQSVRDVPARKNLVMFSEGNNIYNPDEMDTELKIAEESWQKLDRLFNAANVTIYTIKRSQGISQWEQSYYDTSEQSVVGQPIMSRVNIPTMRNSREGSLRLQADVTGGKYYDSAVADEKIIADLISESSDYYTATFIPPQGKPGRLQKLEIDCSKPGCRVIHRSSLFVEKRFDEMSSSEKQLHLAEVLISDSVSNELGVAILNNELPEGEKRFLLLSLSLDHLKVAADKDGKKEIEFLLISEDMKGKELYRKHSRFNLEPGSESPLYFSLAVPLLKEDKTKVNFVLRDNISGLRSNWRGIYQKSKKTEGVYLCPPMLFAADGKNNSWQEELLKEEGASTSVKFKDLLFSGRTLEAEGCLQGESTDVVFLIGNIKDKVDVEKIKAKAGFFLDPREEESYVLVPEKMDIYYDKELDCLVVASRIPLGYAQKASGKLFVAVEGVAPGRAILSSRDYQIVDFKISKAAELLADKKIMAMK